MRPNLCHVDPQQPHFAFCSQEKIFKNFRRRFKTDVYDGPLYVGILITFSDSDLIVRIYMTAGDGKVGHCISLLFTAV